MIHPQVNRYMQPLRRLWLCEEILKPWASRQACESHEAQVQDLKYQYHQVPVDLPVVFDVSRFLRVRSCNQSLPSLAFLKKCSTLLALRNRSWVTWQQSLSLHSSCPFRTFGSEEEWAVCNHSLHGLCLIHVLKLQHHRVNMQCRKEPSTDFVFLCVRLAMPL